MYECKLVQGHSETKKNTFGKTIDEFSKETDEEHFVGFALSFCFSPMRKFPSNG